MVKTLKNICYIFRIIRSTQTWQICGLCARFILEISHKFAHSAQPTNKHPICICNCACKLYLLLLLHLYLRIRKCIFCLQARGFAAFECDIWIISRASLLTPVVFGHNCGRTSPLPPKTSLSHHLSPSANRLYAWHTHNALSMGLQSVKTIAATSASSSSSSPAPLGHAWVTHFAELNK